MKDPAFLFYPNDWLGGTMIMSRLQKGAYIDILMAQFNNGRLSLDDIETLLGGDFEKVWPKLKTKFSQDENGLYYNKRLEQEISKRSEYSESRRQNRKTKTPQDNSFSEKDMNNHMSKDMNNHMYGHMENENRNRNRNINKKENESENLEKNDAEIFEKTDAEIFEEFREAYPGVKRGHETEFESLKKHRDWRAILPTLKKELQRQYYARQVNEKAGHFVPPWKHLKTYINQRGWEEEITINNQTSNQNGGSGKVSDSARRYEQTVADADKLIEQLARERRNVSNNQVRT